MEILKVSCTLVGTAPIGFSAPISMVRKTGEAHDAFELRSWRERMHVDENGELFIPALAIKHCLTSTAQFLSETYGRGKATFTKHFRAGVMVENDLPLGVKADSIKGQRQFVPSDGKTGGGSRVWKTFPVVLPPWSVPCELTALDPVLVDKPDVIERYLGHGGRFIGLGWWRPERAGMYGRFIVEDFKSEKMEG